ncbi:ATP-binding protein [Flavobacterium enshiense]|uniref:tetratricopeptide repeat-containing hybrid sensor histidine kinase/response regulator n=1 Tax=Flavobacterium enshiense TaxID=1341165 RepID=UPI00345D97AF
MIKDIVKILTLFFLFGFQLAAAHDKPLQEKEISRLIGKAGSHLMNLECSQSLKVAQEALTEAHKIKNNLLIAKSYNLIGLNFEEFSDYQKAIEFYSKGLEYANKTSNDTIKDYLYNNLGNVYAYRRVNFRKGIESYKKALFYSQKINYAYEIMYTNLNIACAYFAIEDYKNGLPFLKAAEIYVNKSDELEARISLNSLFGSYYTSAGEFEKAKAHFKVALQLCNEDKPELLETNAVEVYDDVSRFYSKIGDYKNAYLYLEKYNVLKDKLYNDNRSNSTKLAGSDVELKDYQLQINKIELERDKYEKSLKQSKAIVVLFIIIFIVIGLYAYALYKNNKRRVQYNRELKKANEELLLAKEAAEEASRLKSQFISTISHELRTPLYGVVGITNILIDEHKELAKSNYIKSLKFSAKYLLSLVNDILQVYKIEENKITLEDSVFNLSDELNSIIDSLQFMAVKNNNELVLDIDENIPEYLIGDKVRLSQVFMNLASNSLKFTTAGEVKIKAKLIRNEGTLSFIRFEVVDNGIGIKKEDQERIFEKFVQIERREDDYQGTGLGLSIVKKLLHLFGSDIEICSEVNKGTKMSFIIGFDTDEIKRIDVLKNVEVDFSEEHTYKILVVEDNKINQIVTKKFLDVRHFESTIVDDGYKALELLETETFDVILMDINMPIINGFETSKLIREKGITTPIIALTAFNVQEIENQIKESEINDIIIKPFQPNQLYKLIVNLSNKNEMIQKIAEKRLN